MGQEDFYGEALAIWDLMQTINKVASYLADEMQDIFKFIALNRIKKTKLINIP